MSRSTTTAFRQAINAQTTGECFLLLLELSHASLATPIRVVNNTQDIVSNGRTFIGFPFQITLPDDDEEQQPRIRLAIDNVDRTIVTALRALQGPVDVAVEVVRAADPNTIEIRFEGFKLREARYTALEVSGDLLQEDVLSEPFPAHTFSPQFFPGIF